MNDWRRIYAALIGETNKVVLTHLVHQFEEAVFERCQQLAATLNPPELREIKSAVDAVYSVKIIRLGWPDPLAPAGDLGRP